VVVAHVPACALRLWYRVRVSVSRFNGVVNRIDSGAATNYKDSFQQRAAAVRVARHGDV